MQQSVEQIMVIASQARRDFEDGLVTDEELANLIQLHAPQNAETWLPSLPLSRPHFPTFNCGFTSVYLRERLGYGEITNGRYDNKLHTYLAIGETAIAPETIVDITADQYNGPEVYVGPLVKPWHEL
jgi:hypothetical protein